MDEKTYSTQFLPWVLAIEHERNQNSLIPSDNFKLLNDFHSLSNYENEKIGDYYKIRGYIYFANKEPSYFVGVFKNQFENMASCPKITSLTFCIYFKFFNDGEKCFEFFKLINEKNIEYFKRLEREFPNFLLNAIA